MDLYNTPGSNPIVSSKTLDIHDMGISASRLVTPLSRQSDLPGLFISFLVSKSKTTLGTTYELVAFNCVRVGG